MAPSRRWGSLFMVLQVYVDDSTTESDNFVLAGYIATAEEWLKFSRKWEPLAEQ